MTESSTTHLPDASPEPTTNPPAGSASVDITETQDVDFSCDECGQGYTLTQSAIAHWLRWPPDAQEELDRRAMIRSTLGSRPSGWIVMDERAGDMVVCPPCVVRLKPAKAAETCPSWCVTDHAEEKLVGEWCFEHRAPVWDGDDFAIVQWSHSDQIEVEIQVSLSVQIASKAEHDECAAELRKLARAAAAAAGWLEANAPEVTTASI